MTSSAEQDLAEACRLLSTAADACLAPHAPTDRPDAAGRADVADFSLLSLGLGAQLVASQILRLIPPAEKDDHEGARTPNPGEAVRGSNRFDPCEALDDFEDRSAAATQVIHLIPAESTASRQATTVDLVRAADALIRRHPADDFPPGITQVLTAIGDLLSGAGR